MRMTLVLSLLLLLTSLTGQAQTSQDIQNPSYGAGDIIQDIYEDRAGHIWFCKTGHAGIFRYDGNTFTHLTEADGLCNNDITTLLQDKNGMLWLGTLNGICRFQPSDSTRAQGSFQHFPIPGDMQIPLASAGDTSHTVLVSSRIFNLLEDRLGNIWLGTDHGLYRYDGKTFKQYLSQEVISCLVEDHAGTIWVGSWSQGGAYRYDGNRLADSPHPSKPRQHKPQPATKSTADFTRVNGLSDNMIACILEDSHGDIWLGTRDHGVCRYTPAPSRPPRGKGSPNPISYFNEQNGFCTNNVSAILEDDLGHLWFAGGAKNGNRPGGLCRYDGLSFTPLEAATGLENNDLSCGFKDTRGHLWFGGRYGRLFRYDGKVFTDFSKEVH